MLAGSLTWACRPAIGALREQPAWTLATLGFVASIAGFTVAARRASLGIIPPEAVKAGSRAALCAAAVGILGISWAAHSRFSETAAVRVMVTTLLSVLPACFFGALAAGVGAMSYAQPGALGTAEPVRVTTWIGRILVITLAGIGVLAPFLPRRSGTSSAFVRQPPTVSQALVEPFFSYKLPPELANATSAEFRLETQRSLPPPSKSCPPVLSPDGRFLAYVPEGSDSLQMQVRDLHSNAIPTRIRLPRALERLVYSPDGTRLFAVSNADRRYLGVLDLKQQAYIPLPQPKNRQMPLAPVWWWKDHSVLILPETEPAQVLDLETLEIFPAFRLTDWKDLPQMEKSLLEGLANRTALPSNNRWELSGYQQWETAELPEVDGLDKWPVSFANRLAFLAPKHAYARVIPTIHTDEFLEFLGASDGSKAIGIADDKLQVFYFGVRPAPVLRWTLEEIPAMQTASLPKSLQAELESGRLGAVIYAPLINPLNQKTVGPDRLKTRGRVLFSSWKNSTAEVWLAEEWEGVENGDVVADIHVRFDEANATLVEFGSSVRWWQPLPTTPTAATDLTSLPIREALEKKVGELLTKRQAEAVAQAASRQASTPTAPSTPPQPAVPAQETPATRLVQVIRQFVVSHHEKASKSDPSEVMEDYSGQVDYFDHGLVTTDFIRDDATKYRQKLLSSKETVVGDVTIEPQGPDQWQVVYLLHVEAESRNPTGRPPGGDFIVTLRLQRYSSGFEIYYQRSKRAGTPN